jgi:hypothetical protein
VQKLPEGPEALALVRLLQLLALPQGAPQQLPAVGAGLLLLHKPERYLPKILPHSFKVAQQALGRLAQVSVALPHLNVG